MVENMLGETDATDELIDEDDLRAREQAAARARRLKRVSVYGRWGSVLLAFAIVFLSVPVALRHQRNTTRSQDAGMAIAAVASWQAAHKGVDLTAAKASELNGYIGDGDASRMDGDSIGFSYFTLTIAGKSKDIPQKVTDPAKATLNVGWGCNANGTAAAIAKSTKQVALLYAIETSGDAITQCKAS